MKHLISFILALLLFLSCDRSDSDQRSDFSNPEVEKLSESGFYFTRKLGGLVGSVQEISIAKDSLDLLNETNKITFYTDEIFYKVKSDTLEIFAPEPSYKDEEYRKINNHIKIYDLKNKEEIQDYSENYKQYNLERISLY